MLKSTRAAVAVGLGLVGVAGLVRQTSGQDPSVRQAANTPGAGAQAAKAPVTGMPALIGTIDMDQVIAKYDKFRASGEKMNGDALARKNELMKFASEAEAENQKLIKMAPGSMDQKKIEDKIRMLKAQFEAGKESAQAEFSRLETELMAQIFNEVQQMSAAVAKQRGMNMVVKYSATPASASDPKSIEATMFRALVYADARMDITEDVVRYLNYNYQKSGGPAPKGNGAAPAGAAATPGAGAPARTTASGAATAPAPR